MKSIHSILIAVTVLIAVPYMLSADAAEMKHVPFWWSTNEAGEQVYTDYFSESSNVQREHNAYLAATAVKESVSTISPSIMLEVERSNMVEVITYEWKYIKTSESTQPQGPFANPDYMIREKVATSTWIEAPVTTDEESFTDSVTLEVTPEEVTVEDVTPVEEITPEEDVTPVEEITARVSTFDGKTHWDAEEAAYSGQDDMSSQEYKDMKKKHESWKAYETLSKLYPSQYPPYVHDYDHDTHEAHD